VVPATATSAVFTLLQRKISPGEIAKVRGALSAELRALWSAAEQPVPSI
jgi:uncharacterized protein (DUF2267 family)